MSSYEKLNNSKEYVGKDSPVFTNSLSMGRKNNTTIGIYSIALGEETEASGESSFATGHSVATGDVAFSAGNGTASGLVSCATGASTASGDYSHSEGILTEASGQDSHAEGMESIASEAHSHAEGYGTQASGHASHAEGEETIASGVSAHAEGWKTEASGSHAHTEGMNTIATNFSSHAEGSYTVANGESSHAEGHSTKAASEAQHVQGKYNIEDSDEVYAHIVGNGDKEEPSNAHTLDWSGNAWFAGDVFVGSTSGTNKDAGSKKLATTDVATTSTAGLVKIGSNLNISDGTLSVPAATKSSAGVTVVYDAASCTSFSSDSGTCSPLAVQKGAKIFAITRPPKKETAQTITTNAIVRWENADGDVKDSMITIEDVTNTKDSSKKANVLAIPAEDGKKMVYGYCTDQVDGTSFIGGVFDKTATSYPYSAGLAIGGTSGNLLWKGKRVLDNDDLTTLNSSISAADNVFIATYGTTTAAELEAAYQAGKAIFCKYDRRVYGNYRRNSSLIHSFNVVAGSTLKTIQCADKSWTEQNVAVNSVHAETHLPGGDDELYTYGTSEPPADLATGKLYFVIS